MALSILRLNLRVPSFSKASPQELYSASLEMAAWAEKQGFVMVVIPEHHGTEDGYLPAPLPMAGCIAGRTSSIRIGVMALLLNLYDPVRLAEDLAVLDLASGGRLAVTLGQGYRESEYAMFDADWKNRGAVMDDYIEVMLRAWRGEEFEWNGRKVSISPRPLSKPHPFISVGGQGRNAARRAARFGLPFQPSVDNPEITELYRGECARLGHRALVLPPGSGETIWVSDDPDRTWAEIGPYLLHHVVSYAGWQSKGNGSVVDSQANSVEELRVEGKYRVLTPDECVEVVRVNPANTVVHLPLCGGTPPELGWQSLELYASKVLPRL
jgi:alkanesulfonate monooxygenase SsuD/methylene tetrahydromethanopterin reductase-like flavin-dependent oxidoreductase (luciferase family)